MVLIKKSRSLILCAFEPFFNQQARAAEPRSPAVVIALLLFRDWHLHITLTHWSATGIYANEREGQRRACARAGACRANVTGAPRRRPRRPPHAPPLTTFASLHSGATLRRRGAYKRLCVVLMCEQHGQALPVPEALVSRSV